MNSESVFSQSDVEIVDISSGIQEVRLPGWTAPKPVMVSVLVQTYQHGPFIAECLESICTQETDFNYEILVGEDNSTDDTRRICIEYATRFPGKIRLVLHDRSNLILIHGAPTGRFNFLTNLARARGKYIAMCEGDDYWTDTRKLQKQVEFLESNADFSMAYHNAFKVNETGNPIGPLLDERLCKHRTPKEMIAAHSPMHTATVMMRKSDVDQLPDGWSKDALAGDMFVFAFLGQFGKAAFVDVAPSAYRIHDGGAFSKQGRCKRLLYVLHTFRALYHHVPPEYRSVVGYRICEKYNQLGWALLTSGKPVQAIHQVVSYMMDGFRILGFSAIYYQLRWLASVVIKPLRRYIKVLKSASSNQD
jgi:glycosyltransferase involved in cell wall biosynthesis